MTICQYPKSPPLKNHAETFQVHTESCYVYQNLETFEIVSFPLRLYQKSTRKVLPGIALSRGLVYVVCMDTKNSVAAQKAWLKDHMQDTKMLLAQAAGANMPGRLWLARYQEALREHWDRLDEVEKAGEAAGWRE